MDKQGYVADISDDKDLERDFQCRENEDNEKRALGCHAPRPCLSQVGSDTGRVGTLEMWSILLSDYDDCKASAEGFANLIIGKGESRILRASTTHQLLFSLPRKIMELQERVSKARLLTELQN
jgi:hypothetical protein